MSITSSCVSAEILKQQLQVLEFTFADIFFS